MKEVVRRPKTLKGRVKYLYSTLAGGKHLRDRHLMPMIARVYNSGVR